MRIAIRETKVRLDFCISPGLELLSSDMIYIKDSPGYNNILLVSSYNQKFGENPNINRDIKYNYTNESHSHTILKDPVRKSTSGSTGNLKGSSYRSTSDPKSKNEYGQVMLISFGLALVGRFLWLMLV